MQKMQKHRKMEHMKNYAEGCVFKRKKSWKPFGHNLIVLMQNGGLKWSNYVKFNDFALWKLNGFEAV